MTGHEIETLQHRANAPAAAWLVPAHARAQLGEIKPVTLGYEYDPAIRACRGL
jgi:hypothetical protein